MNYLIMEFIKVLIGQPGLALVGQVDRPTS
jgi:hypothetical protein